MATLKLDVIVTNIIDGNLKVMETSKLKVHRVTTIKVLEKILNMFSVIIFHALTVTNDYKQLRVYLEKSSSPLNK